MNTTHVCLTVTLGEESQGVDIEGCNGAGWGVSRLEVHHTPRPRRAEGVAGCAQQPSSKEEGAHSLRKIRKTSN